MDRYDHKKIEEKWQYFWTENPELFAADDKSEAEKAYILDMFPYPSADGLHTGHVESYTATDIISRYLRMKGKNVLHPQGWDAFGLPAENFAIKTKTHPSITTKKAIANFKRQMKMLGLSYDWSREIDSSNPEYYKWTQWFFLLFYKNGLAFKGKAKVNWCPNCQTVLANEQAEGGVCERCGTQVIQKDLEQWFFKITDFIENKGKTSGLLSGLDKIDWPEHTKIAQKNWIGRSEGAEFEMKIEGSDLKIEVFTTRLDTVFGMTHAVIAPEHELMQKLKAQVENWPEVEKYIEQAKKKSELQRMAGWEKVPPQNSEDARNSSFAEGGENFGKKTGIELKGVKLINPFNNEAIPVFVGDYVLGHYGTGAVMAVPAHDSRDYEFAKKHNLEIREVIKSVDGKSSIEKEAFVEDGILINSNNYDGLTSEQAREKLTDWLEKNKIGSRKINYKLRDWLISRQRYWGAPIPIIYCDTCGTVPVPEKDLPVLLPDDVDFMPTGESPLARSKKFQDVKCPECGEKARRESDTMDTFVCSSWYYFRYADPHNEKEFVSKEMIEKWLAPARRSSKNEGGVDLYVGGAEHVVLHLLYSRFFTKVLHNLGLIDFDEPFLKLRHQGIILAQDGRKMSKSLGNVINPDDVVAKYGADALRMFEMFMGPLEDAKQWDTKGIVGLYRFLERAWRLKSKIKRQKSKLQFKIKNLIHKTIKKVTEDIEGLKFNTAIAAMMILVNEFEKQEKIAQEDFEIFLKILSPFAPHIAEEIWQQLGYKKSIFTEKWPEYDPAMVKDEIITLVVQVNGKVRDKIQVAAEISEEEAKKTALASEKIKTILSGQEPKKVIFVKNRLINFVI